MPSQIQQEFILHFGEMGSRWGINRTVGQIYALLFLSERPLCADDIVGAPSPTTGATISRRPRTCGRSSAS